MGCHIVLESPLIVNSMPIAIELLKVFFWTFIFLKLIPVERKQEGRWKRESGKKKKRRREVRVWWNSFTSTFFRVSERSLDCSRPFFLPLLLLFVSYARQKRSANVAWTWNERKWHYFISYIFNGCILHKSECNKLLAVFLKIHEKITIFEAPYWVTAVFNYLSSMTTKSSVKVSMMLTEIFQVVTQRLFNQTLKALFLSVFVKFSSKY